MYEYENLRRIVYSSKKFGDGYFIPVCQKCGRFVKADEKIRIHESGFRNEPNALCKKCGRINMIFEGFY